MHKQQFKMCVYLSMPVPSEPCRTVGEEFSVERFQLGKLERDLLVKKAVIIRVMI
jgi:hypothetical protein